MRISAYGLAVDVPTGWEGRIRRDRLAGLDRQEFRAHPVLHAADFALPEERGDFGSAAVESMQPNNAFVALVEFHPDSVGTALFSANVGMPRQLSADDFSPNQLQRTLRGQAGTQHFFVEEDRAFCLYVVLGSMANRGHVIPRVNAVLAAITIVARVPPEWAEML